MKENSVCPLPVMEKGGLAETISFLKNNRILISLRVLPVNPDAEAVVLLEKLKKELGIATIVGFASYLWHHAEEIGYVDTVCQTVYLLHHADPLDLHDLDMLLTSGSVLHISPYAIALAKLDFLFDREKPPAAGEYLTGWLNEIRTIMKLLWHLRLFGKLKGREMFEMADCPTTNRYFANAGREERISILECFSAKLKRVLKNPPENFAREDRQSLRVFVKNRLSLIKKLTRTV